ncbi:transporter substrate-binding domain-containing protein [Pigmentiphaga litoralis]|uniref:Polar amino acid transport system substrate-binding protein n=1 Tax=Pigmentiphaga litoralis TaxID=516702 RepID=A0A7Y9IPV5_9BURK|nr:transporter substrate-binding domain-containing protein [Pigmentiphaga litoralis]NYE25618.1 polar amino acid transport system substrate-binding protein [Pigmentiphaga litoralis]NYE80770.1 polar amino acid transport system substrate-binding protein [Pigmentiphaga litoralis]
MSIDASLLHAFAPTGRLRVSINVGNPILANLDPASGEPFGVSVDLARELARQLGVEHELVVFKSAGESVAAVSANAADVGFFAVDPLRGEAIAFTEPYVLIEGCYLVRQASPLNSNDEVDQAAHSVVVGKGSAYDLYLTRALKEARIVRAPTSPSVVDTFLAEGADAAAGVRQQLEGDAQRVGGLRVLPGRFMEIRQAMGLPKSRDAAAARHLAAFVESMKASGFVADALKRHGIEGAAVAPLV